MTNELFIKFGAVYHLICALSHLVFPKVFKWQDNLKELPGKKKTAVGNSLNISNLCMLLFWLFFAYLSFAFSHELISTQIGKSILTWIVIIWTVRIFLIQPLFGGFKTKESILRTVFFLIGLLLYLVPWINVFFKI
jgi:hypothetical protein